jgi:argininosuccinate lyase
MKQEKNSNKLWSKSVRPADALIEDFTVGKDRELDLLLASSDIIGSLAHGEMLASVGLLNREEWKTLRRELQSLYRDAAEGTFRIDPGVEDIHSQVEITLTGRLGEAAKKLHTGRSRNDQVLLDLRLYTRDQIRILVSEVKRLFDILIGLSIKHSDDLLPGYTHLQIAMPSSFGLWFSAFAESLVDDLLLLKAAYDIVNKNPLGSAAGYGSSFPLDRKKTTKLLGFDDLNYNSIYAQMGRGRTERIATQALASISETLGRLATDVVLYLSQNFNFISFPDSVTTGSSIMPHKKNPDLFELIRAKCNRIKNTPQVIASVYANLPSGYHRDFQILKQPYLESFEDMKNCLQVTNHALPSIQVRKDILDDETYLPVFSVEKVNELVSRGRSFRDAYHEVAAQVGSDTFQKPHDVRYTHEGSLGNLCLDEIKNSMNRIVEQFSFAKIDDSYKYLLS